MLTAKAADKNVRVFVIWEPVLTTDWGEPAQALTSTVADTRAKHYWDHDRKLSALYGGVSRLNSLAETKRIGFAMKDVIWDVALVYPPGAVWPSAAKTLLAPVVKYRADLLNSF